jgi:hypothetical protein
VGTSMMGMPHIAQMRRVTARRLPAPERPVTRHAGAIALVMRINVAEMSPISSAALRCRCVAMPVAACGG